jgi:hypothetical protein
VLEIKRGKNHQALLEMISAVENEANSFQDDVLNKHFNVNNCYSNVSGGSGIALNRFVKQCGSL